MSIQDVLSAGLTQSANILVKKMQEKVKNKNVPSVVSNAMSVGSPSISENDGNITITIDTKTAPMATAYEWGSGLWSTKQVPELYNIRAKNKPNLVFWWANRQKWFVGPELPIGHPGVEPRPYIEPSITDALPEIKVLIGEEVKATILLGIKEMFKT